MTTEGARSGADGTDDRTLVEAVRRGDPAGLEGMYRRYADRLYTYARAVLHDPEAAADAVHDAFLAAGQRVDQLRDPDRLRPWLYAIVRTECLRRIRERSRSRPLDEAGEPPADLPDHGARLGTEQVRELVHAAAAAVLVVGGQGTAKRSLEQLREADVPAALVDPLVDVPDKGLVTVTCGRIVNGFTAGQEIVVPLKNGEGGYNADERTLDELEGEGRVVFRYLGGNPNGSVADIAGVTNERGNVVGLMPHPEHAVEPGFGPDTSAAMRSGVDGLTLFRSALETVLS